MERQVLLELIDAGEVPLSAHLRERLERPVDAIHVGLVMGRVVDLEQFRRVRGLQRVVLVAERGKLEFLEIAHDLPLQGKGTPTSKRR
jgi:hypothetical protein